MANTGFLWNKRGIESQAIGLILLGQSDQAVAEAIGVVRQTVNKWKHQKVHLQGERLFHDYLDQNFQFHVPFFGNMVHGNGT